jgi:septal ring factor EnvC (AmiA/AmiB activator)
MKVFWLFFSKKSIFLALLIAIPATAAPTRQQLRQAERTRAAELKAQQDAAARADAARADAVRLTAEQAEALAHLRDTEAATEAAAARIAALEQRRREAQARLDRRSADMVPLLPLLERLSLYPAETLLALNLPPEQAIRGMLVLGGLARQLEQDARALRAEQARVALLRAQVTAELPALEAARKAQQEAADALDAQLATTRDTLHGAEADAERAAKRAATAAARANDLRAAIAELEAARRADEARARAEAAQAARQKQTAAAEAARNRQEALARPAGPGLAPDRPAAGAPVAGTVVRHWGDTTIGGPAMGVTYQAVARARVVSPCTGKVVFAAPFRSFGNLMIIDCGGGYHFVLSGFAHMDAPIGRRVAAGAPVGVMPDWDPKSGGERPLLYVELRHHDSPVDPATFLRGKG